MAKIRSSQRKTKERGKTRCELRKDALINNLVCLFNRFIYPTVSRFEVILVAPTTWEIVPETSIKLDDWEHVISFKNVHLAYEGTRLGFREYLCLGTNYNYSEDITSRGRVRIFLFNFV